MLPSILLAIAFFAFWLLLEYIEFKDAEKADRAESERLTKRWLEDCERSRQNPSGEGPPLG
jgi:hypothetical protein